jgi:hypothetical protein
VSSSVRVSIPDSRAICFDVSKSSEVTILTLIPKSCAVFTESLISETRGFWITASAKSVKCLLQSVFRS